MAVPSVIPVPDTTEALLFYWVQIDPLTRAEAEVRGRLREFTAALNVADAEGLSVETARPQYLAYTEARQRLLALQEAARHGD